MHTGIQTQNIRRKAPNLITRHQMNSFGRLFRISIFGESHGGMVGVTLDGVPAGIALSEKSFAADLARAQKRQAGNHPAQRE